MYSSTFADRHPVVLAIYMLDLLLVVAAGELAYFFRFGHFIEAAPYQVLLAFVALIYPVSALFSGLYGSWRGRSAFAMCTSILSVWLFAWGIAVGVMLLFKTTGSFSRQWLALWFVFGFAFIAGYKMLAYKVLFHLRGRGRNTKSILYVGKRGACELIAAKLESQPGYGYVTNGFFELNCDVQALSSAVKQ
mgnify:CR=1 FL=1